MADWHLRILETAQEMAGVETLQRFVWPGSETEIVPAHMLQAAAHNGGLIIGAYPGPAKPFQAPEVDPSSSDPTPPVPIGFVFGFPGFYMIPDGPRLKHQSHMLGVHPDYRDRGLGFALKRSQWQMVRKQGIDLITWTYDPLLSQNAYLNIARLGAVCNTYRPDEYGEMRDGLNEGLPTDRFQVDWWVNSRRVNRRLSKRPRLPLDLTHFLTAGVPVLNPAEPGPSGLLRPTQPSFPVDLPELGTTSFPESGAGSFDEDETQEDQSLLLVEIPPNFPEIKAVDPGLALEWRNHIRILFQELFRRGYLVTDFIYLSETTPHSYYVLSHGQSTL